MRFGVYGSYQRSPHYVVTHMRNKKVTFKGGHLLWQSDFLYHKELLLKERIRSLWEQILCFKRSSYFEKGRNWRESLLDPVVSLYCT